jgi:RNA polymerase sigma factor (sigma-70 family)
MGRTSAQLVFQHLYKLASRHGLALPDHELLQRFILTCDEDAFTALVHRHAAMVLGVCRSILHNSHDAEDIFQAVFLVLARKAASIRKGDSVASYLYAVAYRLARKARVRDAKRREREQRAASPEATPMDDRTWGELRDILHEEVSRLPEKYRAAVVLCYWEGQTHEQAAQQLGCARGTIKDRLERAREMLRTRLARRGLALPAAWFAASLSGGTSSAAVPAALLQATVRGAMLFTVGQVPAGVVSAPAIAFAHSALHTMLLGKLKVGALLVLLMIGVLGGAGLTMLHEAATPAAPEVPAKPTQAAPSPAKERERVDQLGDPLPPGALLRLGTIRFRPGGGVYSLAFLPGGKAIVSTGFKGIYFWDVATGKELQRIKLSDEWHRPFTLSPDGKVLVSTGGGAIQLWEVSTGKELHSLKTKATCLAFSRDGRRLASVDQENTLVLWDWRNRKEERRIVIKGSRLDNVGFGSDDRSVYAWDYQNLSAWDVGTGRPLPGLSYPKIANIGSTYLDGLVLSPDGKFLARSISRQPIRVYETGTWREVKQFAAGDVRVEAFTPDGRGLLVASYRQEEAALWNVARGKEIYRITNGGIPAFSPDGRVLALCRMSEGAICLYDAASGKRLHPLPGHESSVDDLAFSSDGRSIATRAFSDGKVHLWDAHTGKPLHVFSERVTFETEGYSLAFAPDGASVAWGDWGGRIYLRDPRSGRELRRWVVDKEIQAIVQSVSFSSDSQSLVTASYSRSGGKPGGESSRSLLLQTWEVATGKEITRFQTSFWLGGDPPILSSDGKMVLMKGGGRWILRDAIHGRVLARLQMPDTIRRLWFFAFSPDARMLAGSTLQGNGMTLRMWETASGAELLTIPVQGRSDGRVAVSPDGRLLALGGSESIRLWDVATGQEVLQLRGHNMTVHSLCFAPDGKTLASGLSDTTVLIWKLAPLGSRAAPSNSRELEQLWTDLGSNDGPKAYRALWALAATERSIDLLRKHLRPATEAEWTELRRLLDDLNSDQFQTRERASRELERQRMEAEPILEKALQDKPSPEVRRRIEDILGRPRQPPSPELLRRLRAVQVLERLGTAEARELCASLADGVAEARLTREAKATLRRMSR